MQTKTAYVPEALTAPAVMRAQEFAVVHGRRVRLADLLAALPRDVPDAAVARLEAEGKARVVDAAGG